MEQAKQEIAEAETLPGFIKEEEDVKLVSWCFKSPFCYSISHYVGTHTLKKTILNLQFVWPIFPYLRITVLVEMKQGPTRSIPVLKLMDMDPVMMMMLWMAWTWTPWILVIFVFSTFALAWPILLRLTVTMVNQFHRIPTWSYVHPQRSQRQLALPWHQLLVRRSG